MRLAEIKGMELEPENRPQTMQAWLELLTTPVTTVWSTGFELRGGKYTIDSILAQGGFGITYLARDKQGKRFVIKTLNETVQRRPDFAKLQDDFANEALKLAKCNHPHIVNIKEVFHEKYLLCMVMEYIAGENLADRVQNQGVLSEAEALGYIKQIGEALTVVHQNGLLHRDVKPGNIIVHAGKPEAVLIDFGIAREFTPDSPQIHTAYLSHCFAPIEQYQTVAPRGACTDVYALAATLYFLLTNRLPAIAPHRASGTVLESPQQINPSISDRVNQAILKGMEIEAKDRPQSMKKWLELLKEPQPQPVAPPSPQPSVAVKPIIPTPAIPKFTSNSAVKKKQKQLQHQQQKAVYQRNYSLLIVFIGCLLPFIALGWFLVPVESWSFIVNFPMPFRNFLMWGIVIILSLSPTGIPTAIFYNFLNCLEKYIPNLSVFLLLCVISL